MSTRRGLIETGAVPDDADLKFRRALLESASDIVAKGGPQNTIDQGWVDSAMADGISEVEIRAAASSKRPVLNGLEDLIPIDNF